MLSSFCLLAEIDWIRLIFPVVVVIVWIISQVIKVGAGQQASQVAEEGEYEDWYDEAEDEQYSHGGERREEASSDPLKNEIEAFLRKVRGEEPAPALPREPVRKAAPPAPRETPPSPSTPVQTTVVAAAATADSASDPITDRFSSQTARLGADVGQADERAEQHMHEAFDHAVGGLADTSTPAPDAQDTESTGHPAVPTDELSVPSTASEYRDLLSSPDSIRRALVLNEILTRPTNRW